jgi:diphthamide biosynthesis methyltransferase
MTVHAGVASSSMTKATQETAVGEGLAVGCLALGVTGVSSARVDVNLSLSHAWRNWPPARVFTVVKASLDRKDTRRILHDSANRRWSMVAA